MYMVYIIDKIHNYLKNLNRTCILYFILSHYFMYLNRTILCILVQLFDCIVKISSHSLYFIGLSDMCNIAHVKVGKNSNFLFKNNNYLFKNYALNINAQVPIYIYYFKLLNMCKFIYLFVCLFIYYSHDNL
jgi:hypothetical protein